MANTGTLSPEEQAERREQFAQADAISALEGYEPNEFEQAQKERIITGEIDTEEFIKQMIIHVKGAHA